MKNNFIFNGCLVALALLPGTLFASTQGAVSLLQQGYLDCKEAHIQRRKDFTEATSLYDRFLELKEKAVAEDANILASKDPEVVRILSYCETVGTDIARTRALEIFQQGQNACLQAEDHVRNNKVGKAEKAYGDYVAFKKQAVAVTEAVLDVYSVTSGVRRCERVWDQITEAKRHQNRLVAQLNDSYGHLSETYSICQTVEGSLKTDQELQPEKMAAMLADISTHKEQVPNAGLWEEDRAEGFKRTMAIQDILGDLKTCQQSATALVAKRKQAIAAEKPRLEAEQLAAAEAAKAAEEPKPEETEKVVEAAEPVTETAQQQLSRLIANGKKYKLVKRVPPKFPRTASNNRNVNGSVLVEYTVQTNGKVVDATVVKSDLSKLFEKAAISSIMKWRYKPNFPSGEEVQTGLKRARIDFNLAN